MRIRLAILEKDQSYLTRIVSAFSSRFADKFEIYSFTDKDVALATLDSARIDVLVASDVFDIDVKALPKRCGFAYFVDSFGVDTINDQVAICKFQKAELIYRQILSIYSEKAGSLFGMKSDDESTKIFLFNSVSGGTGASSMAAACAVHLASQGKKVLYLDLEKFGSSNSFFSGEGQFDLSDIIYALKSRKTNLSLKLESSVKQDYSGVYFFDAPKVALDMMELGGEDVLQLISEIKTMGVYEYLVLDTDFALNKDSLSLARQAIAVCWIGDGSEISNEKTRRAFQALTILEQNADLPLQNRLYLIYNKFSNKTSTTLDDLGVKSLGGAPKYEHATSAQVLERLAKLELFDNII